MKSAYLLIAHGSREAEAGRSFKALVKKFSELRPKCLVEGAFLQISKPTVPQAIKKCAAAGAGRIFVIPLFLFPGRHVKEDIPRYIEEAKIRNPAVDFHYARPLAEMPGLVRFLDISLEISAKGKR